MSNRLDLRVLAGPLKGKTFAFSEHDTFIFGRMEDCHCCLPDDGLVSRHHFMVEANPPDAQIRDFGSRNGTWVNGKMIGSRAEGETPEQGQRRKYPDVALTNGDKITVGDTTLDVKIEGIVKDTSPVLCDRCGRNVREEVGDLRGGAYICLECRKSI